MEVDQPRTALAGDASRVAIVTTLLLCFAVWLGWYRWSQRHSLAPKAWPVLGVLLESAANWNRVHDWMTEYVYKTPTIRYSLGFGFNAVLTVDPANVEHIMKTNFANNPKGPRMLAINDDFFGQGIFNADGDLWIHQRKVAAIEFAAIRLRTFSTRVFTEYATFLAYRLLDKSKCKVQFDLQEMVTRMTLDTTVRISFGVDLGSLAPDLPVIPVAKSYEMASTCSFARFTHPFWKLEKFLQIGQERTLKKAVAVLDSFAFDVIQRRKKEMPGGLHAEQVNEERDDLLSRFVKMSKQGDSRFGDKALRDIMVNYILAGKDSTSAAICWTVYLLATHPHVCVKVRQELEDLQRLHSSPGNEHNLRSCMGFEQGAGPSVGGGSHSGLDNVGSLTYLHAVLTETMRLYPPLPLNAKEAVADDILPTGSIVRKGDLVMLQSYAMGRMPYVWGLDASEFKPERWIKNGNFQPESNFKYIAFQGGPRLCLGREESYLQMKITVALLTQFFDFQLIPGHKYTYKAMISLIFVDGLAVTLLKRKM